MTVKLRVCEHFGLVNLCAHSPNDPTSPRAVFCLTIDTARWLARNLRLSLHDCDCAAVAKDDRNRLTLEVSSEDGMVFLAQKLGRKTPVTSTLALYHGRPVHWLADALDRAATDPLEPEQLAEFAGELS